MLLLKIENDRCCCISLILFCGYFTIGLHNGSHDKKQWFIFLKMYTLCAYITWMTIHSAAAAAASLSSSHISFSYMCRVFYFWRWCRIISQNMLYQYPQCIYCPHTFKRNNIFLKWNGFYVYLMLFYRAMKSSVPEMRWYFHWNVCNWRNSFLNHAF